MTILYLKEAARDFWPVVCICMVKVAYPWSTPAYTDPCTRAHGRR